MNVAILSESEADETALHIFLEAVLGAPVEVIARRVRSRGLQSALAQIPPVLKELHYQRPAEALVIVVDTDDSPVHRPTKQDDECNPECRLCTMRTQVQAIQTHLRPLPGFASIKTALGVAPPAIEAWLLAAMDVHISETWWQLEQQNGVRAPAAIRELKQKLYGRSARSQIARLSAVKEAASKVADNISSLEKRFPNSFGPFAEDVRKWGQST